MPPHAGYKHIKYMLRVWAHWGIDSEVRGTQNKYPDLGPLSSRPKHLTEDVRQNPGRRVREKCRDGLIDVISFCDQSWWHWIWSIFLTLCIMVVVLTSLLFIHRKTIFWGDMIRSFKTTKIIYMVYIYGTFLSDV